jgi:microcystin-dependent protein
MGVPTVKRIMKNQLFPAGVLTLLCALNVHCATAFAQGTAFSYQGQLNAGAGPANGNYDLRFTVCDAVTNGNFIAGPDTNTATGVTNGLFAVTLDFGPGVFTGPARWLQLDVRTNGNGAFTPLAPRQPLMPVPYAIMANNASNVLGNLPVAQLSGTLPTTQLPGSVLTNNASGVVLTGTFTGNGSSVTNVNLQAVNADGAISWIPNLAYATNFTYATNYSYTTNITYTTNTISTTNQSAGFNLATTPGTGASSLPCTLVAFTNADGNVDLVCGDVANNQLLLLTNNGSGVFTLSTAYGTLGPPYSLIMADVNGDGRPDLICVNYNYGGLMIFTNNGTGGFAQASMTFHGTSYARSVAAFKDDNGKTGFVFANYADTTALTVLTNIGGGNFTIITNLPVAGNPIGVTAADVNGDGFTDLIYADWGGGGNGNSLVVLTNGGKYAFGPAVNYTVGNGPVYVTAADVNGDSKPDLISANYTDGTLSVLTNNGGGGFSPAGTYKAGSNVWSVTVADVNNDARPDLISANSGTNTLSVYTNDGSGNFALLNNFTVGWNPYMAVVVDVNHDGKADIVCTDLGDKTLTVLTNYLSYTITSVTNITTNAPTVTTNIVSINTNALVIVTTNAPTASFTGSFSGDGAGLTNLSLAQLPGSIVTNTESGVTLSGTFSGNGAGLTNQSGQSLATTIPVGTVVASMAATIPSGWLLCDGTAVSRSQYAALFSAISTSSGYGDGSTTFNLPDLRGMFLRGLNGSRTDTNYYDPDSLLRTNAYAGGNTGDNLGSVQTDQFRSHNHPGGGQPLGAGVSTGGYGSPATTASTGFSGGNETRPKNVYVNYLIKY